MISSLAYLSSITCYVFAFIRDAVSPISDLIRPIACLLVSYRISGISHRQPLMCQTTCHTYCVLSPSSVLQLVTLYSVYLTSYVALQAPDFSGSLLASNVLPVRSLSPAAAEQRRVNSQLLRSSVSAQLLPQASCHFPLPSDRVTIPFCLLPLTSSKTQLGPYRFACISYRFCLSCQPLYLFLYCLSLATYHASLISYRVGSMPSFVVSLGSNLSSLVARLLSCITGSLTWYIFLYV